MSADKTFTNETHTENPKSEVQQLRTQVNEIKNLLSKLEKESWKEAYSPSNIRKIVEGELTSSGMYKLGRWVVLTFVTLGAIVWFGGTIYSGIHIESVEKRSKDAVLELNSKADAVATKLDAHAKTAKEKLDEFDQSINTLGQRLETIEREKLAEVNKTKSEILNQIADAGTKVSSAARSAQIAFDEKKAAVTGEARNTIKAINSLEDSSLININQTSEASLKRIRQEQEIALELLNITNLPDLREINIEIRSLEEAGGKLNLINIHKLTHWSWWILVVSTILLALFGIFSWYHVIENSRK